MQKSKGNPEPSLSKHRIEVKCSICGRVKSMNMFEFKKNTTGNFYCSKECLSAGHHKNFLGSNNPFCGKKHSAATIAKMTGENHWNFGNKTAATGKAICKNCGEEFEYELSRTLNRKQLFCGRECRYSYDKSTRLQLKCAWCGKDIIKRAGFFKDNEKAFCNRTCYSNDKRSRITKVCSYCGKEYEVITGRKGSSHYCSEECYFAGKLNLTDLEIAAVKGSFPDWSGGEKVALVCEKCGTEFKTPVRRFLQGQRFCSMICYVYSEIWNGGSSFEPYDENFNRQLKRMTRRRDEYTCQLCGIKENGTRLAVHHIDYDKNNNNPWNLISLCHSCHSKTSQISGREKWTKCFQTLLHRQEGATTIPSGSTPQANGGGSAEHPFIMGDDIVCSSRKLEAVF